MNNNIHVFIPENVYYFVGVSAGLLKAIYVYNNVSVNYKFFDSFMKKEVRICTAITDDRKRCVIREYIAHRPGSFLRTFISSTKKFLEDSLNNTNEREVYYLAYYRVHRYFSFTRPIEKVRDECFE
ncbi:MAG: hypothetical protein OWT28_07755 [Firmicutes bacterium]|nr:hypothetical protein [Bacillota bacterium]